MDTIIGFLSAFVGVGIAFLAVMPDVRKRYKDQTLSFFRWVKGYRRTYFITTTGEVHNCKFKMRKPGGWPCGVLHVLEISRGLFRRRSALYNYVGNGPGSWDVGRTWTVSDGSDQLYLFGKTLQSAPSALRLIYKYRSVAGLEDQIARLDEELRTERNHAQYIHAGITAILELAHEDRQKYRSQSAQKIREWVDILDARFDALNKPTPRSMEVGQWRAILTETK